LKINFNIGLVAGFGRRVKRRASDPRPVLCDRREPPLHELALRLASVEIAPGGVDALDATAALPPRGSCVRVNGSPVAAAARRRRDHRCGCRPVSLIYREVTARC
jgi:hypothetical protein